MLKIKSPEYFFIEFILCSVKRKQHLTKNPILVFKTSRTRNLKKNSISLYAPSTKSDDQFFEIVILKYHKKLSYRCTAGKPPGGWGFFFTFQMRLAQKKTPPLVVFFPYSINFPAKRKFEGGVFFSRSTNIFRLAQKKTPPPGGFH